ncbi:MAG: FtsX-like permease family protein, partial [Bacteroidota bacterium]
KEVGIRKVIGSSVLQLRMKFFVESFLLNFLAAAAAIVIIWLISEPYKELVGLPLSLEVISNSETWVLLGSLMLVSAVLSGIFPAYLMGSFKPIQVLKGKLSPALGNGALRKVLVAVQFCIAIFLLIQTFIASEQLEYMLQKDLGMDTEQVVVISIPPVENEKASITSFQNELNSRASFTNTAVSNPVPGLPTGTMSSSTNISLDRETKELKNNFFIYAIDSNFFQTMEMEMIAGNDFSQASNYEFPFIVNEEALRIWGIADPEEVLQEKSSFWGRKHTLVGVVKNFHQLGVKSAHLPMIFVKCNCESDYLSVKLGSGNPLQQVQELEEVYSQHYPNTTFDSFFLDQNFEAQYQSEQQTRKIFSALSVFALLITCLGLFGLSSYTVSKRTKEIGIRKVLGASAKQIIVLLAKDFVWLSLISSVIAIPVTYLLIQNWLEQYAFRIDLNPWLFALPAGFVLLVSFLTVFSKTLKASTLDPVQSLRDE